MAHVLSYKCRMYLPSKWERNHFVPDLYPHAPRESEVQMIGLGYTLYDMVADHCYPDPPDFHIARFKSFFQVVDPGKFQDGVIKDTIEQKLSAFWEDRDRIVKDYCIRTQLPEYYFPRPLMINAEKPVFATFGPHRRWIDRIIKSFENIGIYVESGCKTTVSVTRWILSTELMVLAILIGTSQPVPLVPVAIQILATTLFGIIISNLRCHWELRKATINPIICPNDLTLADLFEDLQSLRKNVSYPMSNNLPSPDMLRVKTTTRRSRNHPNKKAYSIQITSEVRLRPKILLGLIKENVILHIDIVGESVNGPHIIFFWFDCHGLLAGSALRAVNYVKDKICWLTCMQLDSHDKFVSSWQEAGYNRESAFLTDETKIEYWPDYYPKFRILYLNGFSYVPKSWKRAMRDSGPKPCN